MARPIPWLGSIGRSLAAQALGCVVAMRKSGAWDGAPGPLYMAQEYSRLEGVPSHKRLAGRLRELAQYIRDNAATRRWTPGLVLAPEPSAEPVPAGSLPAP